MGAMASKKARRGQRTGRDNRRRPVFGRQRVDLFARDRDQRMAVECRRDISRKRIPVDCERAACRQFVGITAPHDQRSSAPHLFV
jgi:hypothetical protein